VTELPPKVLAAFDQVHASMNLNIDTLVAAHRASAIDEPSRIFSIMSIVDQADRNPYGAHRMLAIAIDRLAGIGDE
jgi:hypothetical protein